MKKTFYQSAIALSILFALTTINPAAAADKNTPVTEMKLVGKINNQPVYELNINNAFFAAYTIVVTDEYGEVLHEETVSGVNISRKFQINTEELGRTGVRFDVKATSRKSTAFRVKNNIVDVLYDSTEGVKK